MQWLRVSQNENIFVTAAYNLRDSSAVSTTSFHFPGQLSRSTSTWSRFSVGTMPSSTSWRPVVTVSWTRSLPSFLVFSSKSWRKTTSNDKRPVYPSFERAFLNKKLFMHCSHAVSLRNDLFTSSCFFCFSRSSSSIVGTAIALSSVFLVTNHLSRSSALVCHSSYLVVLFCSWTSRLTNEKHFNLSIHHEV